MKTLLTILSMTFLISGAFAGERTEVKEVSKTRKSRVYGSLVSGMDDRRVQAKKAEVERKALRAAERACRFNHQEITRSAEIVSSSCDDRVQYTPGNSMVPYKDCVATATLECTSTIRTIDNPVKVPMCNSCP